MAERWEEGAEEASQNSRLALCHVASSAEVSWAAGCRFPGGSQAPCPQVSQRMSDMFQG